MATTLSRGFGCPLKYIQGPGEFNNLEKYTSVCGKKVLLLIDGFLFDNLSARVNKIYTGTESTPLCVKFTGECCFKEIHRVSDVARDFGAEIIVGIGGGKTIDTAKMVAEETDLIKFIVPTSASTDAPTSALAVLYTEDGVHDGSKGLRRHADLVLMDTDIIMSAPIRLFVAGMGDALATYFEAQAIYASDTPNIIGSGYKCCKAAMAIAKLSYDIIMEKGEFAKMSVECGSCNEAVEDVIEANTLLSGLGFENTGCAAAHGVHAGLTALEATHSYLHGEKVAFGIICELVLENAPMEEIDKVMRFLVNVGLPVTLEEFDVEPTAENVYVIADKTANGNALVHHEPFETNLQNVTAAIYAAEALGKKYLAELKK